MTDEEIDKMEAGREMDALIHKHVFGFKASSTSPWRYSTDIHSAWMVVDRLISDYYLSLHFGEDGFYCHFDDFETGKHHGEAPTAPLAICRAALKCCRNVAGKEKGAGIAPVNA